MNLKYIIKRLLYIITTLFGVSIITFVILRVIPGNPIAMMLPPQATQQDIIELKAQYGLDKAIPIQYGIWLINVVQGDFGVSIHMKQDVMELVIERLPATLELVLAATAIALILGIFIGTLSIMKKDTFLDKLGSLMAVLGLAIPDFLWGLLFIIFFGVFWHVLPISGRIASTDTLINITGFFLVDSLIKFDFKGFYSVFLHLILPAFSLALPLTAIVIRVIKSSLLEVVKEDYILLARVKGLAERVVIFIHALRNALIPTTTIVGVQFGFLMGGTVLVEIIYSWPGLGKLAVTAIITRDLPLIQGVVLVLAFIFVIVNLIVDLLYTFINPKIRYG
ncbi:MAG: ABC transporter permease [Deltaproteobacteria bacterium]|nr:ABC transporter permease [Deltaproteobacteria bacterium]